MRVSNLIFLLLFLAHTAPGQTFFPIPAPLQQQEVALNLATECTIFFEKTGDDTLQLRWKKIEVSHPETWTLDLCDFGLCYIGIPTGGLMNPAVGAEQPYLKLIVQPGETPGVAWLWFRVWEDGNPANAADVFFSLHTPGVTGAQEPDRLRVRVFPNPTAGWLFLENPGNQPIPATLFDAAGRMAWSGPVFPGEQQALDLSAQPAGFYFLKLKDETVVVQRVH